ncbi:MAG: ubiquitin-like protein UBact [Nitrospirae bacterium]|nr:ubiquitin-like protein UBact [Nitrospirota bacterium]MBI3352598.1 ubiquitin-like protein UBact [Nitrospirota bacterium]
MHPALERREQPINPLEKPKEEAGPKKPDTDSSRENLLKRMKKVDPKQAERYRQRTGE